MKQRQIYIGDYVRLSDAYLRGWTLSESSARIRALRDTIFLVTEVCRCYNWSYGIGGGGMLLTLKPFTGPLVDEDVWLGRGEESVELMDPAAVDQILTQYFPDTRSLKDTDPL